MDLSSGERQKPDLGMGQNSNSGRRRLDGDSSVGRQELRAKGESNWKGHSLAEENCNQRGAELKTMAAELCELFAVLGSLGAVLGFLADALGSESVEQRSLTV